jgi:hypothetical protein
MIAVVLGIPSVDLAARLIAATYPDRRRQVRKTQRVQMKYLTRTLNLFRSFCVRWDEYEEGKEPTLSAWLQAPPPIGRRLAIALFIERHVLVYHNGRVIDNNTKAWVPVKVYARECASLLDAKVISWYAVDHRRRVVA